jgi:osmoprotectant transport system substrate-binding protein
VVAAASPVAGGPKPTVKVGSANFPEQVVLGELYAQMLEANGYTVERHLNLGTREIVEPALESGQIDMYPEYMATLLAFVSQDPNLAASSDPATTFKNLQTALQPKNITVLNYAQAQDENGFAVTQATAQKYNLKNMSDLGTGSPTPASQMVLGGAPECPERPFCLPGLQQTYGLNFKDFKPLDAGGPLTVQALQSGDIDIGELFTTDPNISVMNFVELNDDKHLQLSDNVAPVVRNQILSQSSDIQSLSNQVSAKLSTNDLINLNKSVEIDHQDPKDVAAAYLKQQGLTH